MTADRISSDGDEQVFHTHKVGGNPYVYIAPDGRPLGKSDTPLSHSHEGGDRPHKHLIRTEPIESDSDEPSFNAVRDDTPYFLP